MQRDPEPMKVTLVPLALLASLVPPPTAHAEVRLLLGPTPIPRASAGAAGDITVVNEELAFALAVQSAAPYGVPRGALVAIAPVTDGTIGRNRVVFADFIPNNCWSTWPNTYQHVDILERGPREVRIRAVVGTETHVETQQPLALDFDLASVAGLKQAQLISGETIAATQSFAEFPLETHATFVPSPEHAGWYALIVEDRQDRRAYTDPIWVLTNGATRAPRQL